MATTMGIAPVLTPSSALAGMEAEANRVSCPISTLTKEMAAGREEAFRTFHELYFDRLLRYHLVIAHGNEESAREALQETFLRVSRHARAFQDKETFWCWLTVVARSAACDGGRKRQRYWRMITGYARSLISPASCPEPEDADQRLYQHIVDSLAELPPLDRSLVEGKYLQRKPVRELASEYGLTSKAVESRLQRARVELRLRALRRIRDET